MPHGITVVVLVNGLESQVRVMDKTVSILLSANALEKSRFIVV